MPHALSRRLARGAIRLANWLVDGTVLSAVVMIIAFTTFVVLDNGRVSSGASVETFDSYRPDAEGASFEELQGINPDVIGWLTIYGTGVDYPLVQGRDNDAYVNTNPVGEFALSGSLFLDWRNAPDFSDRSTIVFGHHMEDSLMFGDLDQYGNQGYLSQHRYGNLYYGGRDHGVEIFGYLLVDARDEVVYATSVGEDPSSEDFLAYLEAHASVWESGVTPDDRVLVLSTCGSGTNDRHVVVACIRDQTFEDTFPEKEVSRTLAGTAEGVRLGMQIGGALVVFLLIAWVVGAPSDGRGKRRGRER
ncbi:MAG: class B sortase [Acidobacteriota bacterium]|nr:class B sortase [Acidobacteriota bacterium]